VAMERYNRARDLYKKWGSIAKVERIEAKFVGEVFQRKKICCAREIELVKRNQELEEQVRLLKEKNAKLKKKLEVQTKEPSQMNGTQ